MVITPRCETELTSEIITTTTEVIDQESTLAWSIDVRYDVKMRLTHCQVEWKLSETKWIGAIRLGCHSE